MRIAAFVAVCLAVFVPTFLIGADQGPKPDPKIDFPQYRAWSHVKTMIIHDPKHPLFESFGGMHHVYANEKAFPSTTTMTPYPKGSVLVFVLYDVTEKDGAYIAGARKLTAVMEKKGKYDKTGGWGFQAWGRDGKPMVYDGGVSCFGCHKDGAGTTDFVFSRYQP
jgi:hypothetical protein